MMYTSRRPSPFCLSTYAALTLLVGSHERRIRLPKAVARHVEVIFVRDDGDDPRG